MSRNPEDSIKFKFSNNNYSNKEKKCFSIKTNKYYADGTGRDYLIVQNTRNIKGENTKPVLSKKIKEEMKKKSIEANKYVL
jgi:hypothetical protein